MHLKRQMMPGSWKVSRKAKTYAVAPSPGPHAKKECIPLQVIIRDILKYAETGDEARSIIKRGMVLVDGVVRKDHRYPAGFMDSVTIKPTNENFRITLAHNGLSLEKTSASDASKKLCIVMRKYTAKGGVQFISLHDGRTLKLGKGDGCRPGDTVAIEVPSQKVAGNFKVEKGADVVILKGRNMGMHGKVKEIRDRKFMGERSVIVIESGGKEVETLKEYAMALGKGAKK